MTQVYALSYPLQALLATIFTWSVTALGAAVVLLVKKPRAAVMDCMLGFGAGVMMASSFWSLLEPGIAMSGALGQPGWLIACAGFLCGGALLTVGDAALNHVMPASTLSDSHRRSVMLITSITLHNIPEGLAVGVAFGALAFEASDAAVTGAWMLALGIGLQNFPEGAAVSLPLRREGMTRGRAFFIGQLSGIVEPIAGVLGAVLAVTVREVLPFMLCFAAGAMISVVVTELIPESQRSAKRNAVTWATMAGFAIMMVLDVALG